MRRGDGSQGKVNAEVERAWLQVQVFKGVNTELKGSKYIPSKLSEALTGTELGSITLAMNVSTTTIYNSLAGTDCWVCVLTLEGRWLDVMQLLIAEDWQEPCLQMMTS